MRRKQTVPLPQGVHRIVSRGREYFYFQAGRGTSEQGPRIRITHEPNTPHFWEAVRQAKGVSSAPVADTVNALVDQYLIYCEQTVAPATLYHYRRSLDLARIAWGDLPAAGVRPSHVQAIMDGLVGKPSKANHFLGTMKTMSSWARARDLIVQSMTDGVRALPIKSGHKPWTDDQVKTASERLSGVVRRGFMLYLFTGQRGSDIVRLGWSDIDDGGLRLTQRKTQREVWCPIVPELAAEIATWEKQPGPFLKRADGKPMSRRLYWKYFDEAREKIPELAGVTLHGLRCTAVVRLRREGLEIGQIGDIVGMSLPMIQRYCRFANKKKSGQAALLVLDRNAGRTSIVQQKGKM